MDQSPDPVANIATSVTGVGTPDAEVNLVVPTHTYEFRYKLSIDYDVPESALVEIANSVAEHMAKLVGLAAHQSGISKPIIEVESPAEVEVLRYVTTSEVT